MTELEHILIKKLELANEQNRQLTEQLALLTEQVQLLMLMSSRNRQFLLISFLHFLLNKFLHFLIEIHSLYFSFCSFRHSFVSLQHGGEDDLGLQSQSLHCLEVLPINLDFCLTLI